MEYSFSDRVKNLKGNAIREIFKVLSDPEMISFAGGFPASDCLSNEKIAEISERLLRGKNGKTILQYGGTEGYLPFRETAASYVRRMGIQGISTDNVLAISGGQQGIDLMCKCLLNKGDCVLVENPTYLAVLHILKTYEANAYGVNSDEDGMNLEDLEKKIILYKPKFVYVVPNFSNPTGRTLSEEKRERLVDICFKHNVLVLEDDPYRELRYEGEPLKAIYSYDKGRGCCVYVTSFSKTVAPGLRVGAAIAHRDVLAKLTIAKQAVDVHTSTLSQAIVNEVITSGFLEENIQKAIPVYRERRDAMIGAIGKYMPKSFRYSVPMGGLFIWGEFTDGQSAKAAFSKALENKVAYVCGNDFFADGSGDSTLRLNFSNGSPEIIETGMKRLSKLF